MTPLHQAQCNLARLGERIGQIAAQRIGERIAAGDLKNEEEMTSALADRIVAYAEDEADNWEEQFGLRASILHKRLEEPVLGGDLIINFTAKFDKLKYSTSTLAQAKRQPSGGNLRAEEWRRLQRQIDAMQAATTAAYIWSYSPQGLVAAYPVVPVSHCTSLRLDDIDAYDLGTFLSGIMTGKIGDSRIAPPAHAVEDSATPPDLVRYILDISISNSTEAGLKTLDINPHSPTLGPMSA